MKIMDISVAFQEGMMKYPSLLPFERKWLRSFENGDQNQVSYIQSPSHNGTHLDAPSHFIKGGKTMDDIPLDRFYGTCQVIEIPADQKAVTREFLKGVSLQADKVLLKTTNCISRMEGVCRRIMYIWMRTERNIWWNRRPAGRRGLCECGREGSAGEAHSPYASGK